MHIETENEIKIMLSDIIINGSTWEYCITECPEPCDKIHSGCAFDCTIKNTWKPYKLGEAINPKYAYRKRSN